MFRSTIAFAAVIAALSAMPAAAQETDQVKIYVNYADLNLAHPAGQAAFKKRIDQAVSEICGSGDIRDLNARSVVSHCSKAVWNTTRPEVDRAIAQAATPLPVLTASR